MNYRNIHVTTFQKFNVPIGWPEIKFGIEHNLLSEKDVENFATDYIVNSNNKLAIEIAGGLSRQELLEKLNKLSPGNEESAAERWLLTTLKFIYLENMTSEKKLDLITEVYADFEYPEIMKSFINYMPPEDGYLPEKHSHDENIIRLMKKWQECIEYLEARNCL